VDTPPERDQVAEVLDHREGRQPRPVRALAVITLVATAAALAVLPTGAPGAGLSALPSTGATWLFDLAPRARASVQVDLAEVTPVAQPLIRRLSGMASFDDRVSQCRPPAVSCSTSGSGIRGRWGIHLDAGTTAFTYPSNRFLVYHEIGHAQWRLLLGSTGQRRFAQAISHALRGRRCLNDQGRPCAVLPEMFADEFARYVGGFAASMSYYCTPPLLDAATFGALVGIRQQPAPRPRQEYLQRTAFVNGKLAPIKIDADAANVREDRGVATSDHDIPAR
jgi:hypothetical protein